jgi:hypothetical protein
MGFLASLLPKFALELKMHTPKEYAYNQKTRMAACPRVLQSLLNLTVDLA